jgi:hypothetical protein
MKKRLNPVWLGLLFLGSTAPVVQAQSGGVAARPDSAAPDSAAQDKKKGGGLFGKAKKFAGNKAVQQVAKTMACTMVPGGQVIAGAIDAAGSDNVGEAASGAAGAAAGQTCMPGGMGAGMTNPGTGMASVPGLGMAAGAEGLAGMAGGGMSGAAMGHGAAGGGMGPEAIAACMGLSMEEFLALSDPTGGEARQPTKEEMNRQAQLTGKIDMAGYQACLTQERTVAMAAGGGTVPVRESAAEDGPAGGKPSEAPGKSVDLPADLEKDLGKGRLVIRDIDWLTSGADVASTSAEAFAEAVAKVSAAMREVGGTYRADIYLDKRYEDAAAAEIGSARLANVVAALEKAGLASGTITGGKAKKDKRPRLEIVRAKP